MREIPILFSGEMVRAILEGRKTETRRIVKGAEKFPDIIKFSPWIWEGERQFRGATPLWGSEEKDGTNREWGCPYGDRSDRLWVRETWREALSETHACYAYRADNSYQCGKQAPDNCNATWKPSIHMPKRACRLWLEVLDVRVERLQDITEEGAIAEGIESKTQNNITFYKVHGKGEMWQDNPIWSFRSLWESIHGAGSWDLNPWLWVISFKKTPN